MSASRLCESRHVAPLLRMFSDFIARKHSPNILVRFGPTSGVRNKKEVCATLLGIVQEYYGTDRFVVYPVEDLDLKCDSRTWSAAGIVDISPASDHILTIPSLELRPEILADDQRLRKELVIFFNDHIEPLSDKFSGTINKQELAPTPILSMYHHGKSFDTSLIKDLFNFDEYFAELHTPGSFGRNIRFQEVTTSTMELIKDVRDLNGSLAVCNYQLSGIGRNDNQWLSPRGCAMWTVNLFFPLSDPLFPRLCLLQHIASLAVLQAIPSFRELDVRIKWPNDIVYTKSNSKLCGMITKSEFATNIAVQIGIGMNVSNRYPSICLDELVNFRNRFIELNNGTAGKHDMNGAKKLKLLSRESLIARFMNNFQSLLSRVITSEGLLQFKEEYVNNWIHKDAIVDIDDNRSGNRIKRRAKIIGIDDQGFLLVVDLVSGEVFSLQSDGNRFDLMNSLVILNK